MVLLKSEEEIEKMARAGKIAAEVMRRTLGWVHPGLRTAQVDKFIKSQITNFHAKSSFTGVDGYKFSSCISINEEMVHGIPSDRKLRMGDFVSIDMGVRLDGFNSDMCATVLVGRDMLLKKGKSGKVREAEHFLSVGRKALDRAISKAVIGNYIGDISSAMQTVVEGAGYSVVRQFVGHGIGKSLHEDPQIPCFGKASEGLKLENGMVLAIEVMYAKGSAELIRGENGWVYKTKDGSVSAMFEHTVAVTSDGFRVLTN